MTEIATDEGKPKATGWTAKYIDGKWVEDIPKKKVVKKKAAKKPAAKKTASKAKAAKKVDTKSS